jgi:hypothetical protein
MKRFCSVCTAEDTRAPKLVKRQKGHRAHVEQDVVPAAAG